MTEEYFTSLQEDLLNPNAKKSSIWNKIGVCYMQGHGVQKDLNKAFKAFQKATTFETVTSNAWLNLAHCYENAIGTNLNHRRAYTCIQQALHIKPKNALAWNKLGLYYLYAIGTKKSETNAIKAFLEAVKQSPLYSTAWINLGVCYKNAIGTRCRTLWAERCFRNAREVEPQTEMSWRQLGFLALDFGDYSSAVRRFTIARGIAENMQNGNFQGYDEYINAIKKHTEQQNYMPLYKVSIYSHPIQFMGRMENYQKCDANYQADVGERPIRFPNNGLQQRPTVL